MFGLGCDDEKVVCGLNVAYYAVVCKGMWVVLDSNRAHSNI